MNHYFNTPIPIEAPISRQYAVVISATVVISLLLLHLALHEIPRNLSLFDINFLAGEINVAGDFSILIFLSKDFGPMDLWFLQGKAIKIIRNFSESLLSLEGSYRLRRVVDNLV